MTANGQQTPEELAVASAVQHHVASYQRVVAERDELQRQLDKMEQALTVSKIEIEGLRAERAAAVTRMDSYQQERDQAVAQRAAYEMLFATVQAQLRVFKLPAVPLIADVKSNEPYQQLEREVIASDPRGHNVSPDWFGKRYERSSVPDKGTGT